MSDVLDLATFRYDTTAALLDGLVDVAGVPITRHRPATLPELFDGLLGRGAYDISELGLTYYLRTLDHGAPYVALPVFPARAFRHASVWVRSGGPVAGPEDLSGRTLGEFGLYGQDSGLWIKGILADEYGFDPAACSWVVGGLDAPAEPFAFAPPPHSPPARLRTAGSALAPLLADGEIDALFTSNVPQLVLDGSDAIRPLFPDAEARERDYYRRTGIFPIMHTVVVRRDVLVARPGLARAVYDAFRASKELGAQRYLTGRRLYQVTSMLPWTHQLAEADHDLLGDDWWPYGIERNGAALDTALRYHHEQGLTSRRWAVEEVFAADLLDT